MAFSCDIRVLRPVGLLSIRTAEILKVNFKTLFERGAEVILVDLDAVTYLDSSGLGLLVDMHTKQRLANRRLCLCSANNQVKTLFDISGLDAVLEIFASQDDFLASIETRPDFSGT